MPDQKTPPAVLITRSEKGVVRRAVRTLVKALVPHLPAIAKFGGPAAVGFILTTAHTWKEKIETQRQIKQKAAEVEKMATKTTAEAYKGLAVPASQLQMLAESCEKRLTAVEATQKAQSAVIVARERDFVVEGRPATARARRVDKVLVDAVKANAAKNGRELEARKAKPLPVLKPIPLELPAAGAGGASPQPVLVPPPQPKDAGRSP
jgi:hypothetical protein